MRPDEASLAHIGPRHGKYQATISLTSALWSAEQSNASTSLSQPDPRPDYPDRKAVDAVDCDSAVLKLCCSPWRRLQVTCAGAV